MRTKSLNYAVYWFLLTIFLSVVGPFPNVFAQNRCQFIYSENLSENLMQFLREKVQNTPDLSVDERFKLFSNFFDEWRGETYLKKDRILERTQVMVNYLVEIKALTLPQALKLFRHRDPVIAGAENGVVLVAPRIQGTKDSQNDGTGYMRTDRGFRELSSDIYSLSNLENLEWKGKKILDAGTGDGLFVQDLRSTFQADAHGIDIELNELQKLKPYFSQQNMTKTNFENETFDRIFSNYSFFHYHQRFSQDSPDAQTTLTILQEMARILKDGGDFYFGPFDAKGSIIPHVKRWIEQGEIPFTIVDLYNSNGRLLEGSKGPYGTVMVLRKNKIRP